MDVETMLKESSKFLTKVSDERPPENSPADQAQKLILDLRKTVQAQALALQQMALSNEELRAQLQEKDKLLREWDLYYISLHNKAQAIHHRRRSSQNISVPSLSSDSLNSPTDADSSDMPESLAVSAITASLSMTHPPPVSPALAVMGQALSPVRSHSSHPFSFSPIMASPRSPAATMSMAHLGLASTSLSGRGTTTTTTTSGSTTLPQLLAQSPAMASLDVAEIEARLTGTVNLQRDFNLIDL
eukprot:TRINITY_DN483_c0_g7_i1.p1 TRINITY_DN483_c0_g7~~TRINITY_DN483_c0_g7_i1.p1  ORF type:complete len:272 (-),score=78.57 TRINITY_DN483_c0_g7_i1:171-902(-)